MGEMRREVRGIRATQTKMEWDVLRAANREKREHEKALEDEIREARAREAADMKAHLEEQNMLRKARDLAESKENQLFKRACKARTREEESRLAEEAYAKTLEYSAWKTSQAKAASDQAKAMMLDRARNILEIKESKRNQALQGQAKIDAEREAEKIGEMAQAENELLREKERLLADLEYMHGCQNMQQAPS